jgi:glycosidase
VKRGRGIKKLSLLLVVTLVIQLFMGIFPAGNSFITVGNAEEPERVFTLVGNLQDELGHTGEWDPSATTTDMQPIGNNFYVLTGTLPAGSYEYKIAVNRSWDENYGYGGRNGGNFTINLIEETVVSFYYHDGTHGVADTTWYNAIPQDKQPRIAGDIQPVINAGDSWSPSTSTAILYDDNFDGVYTYSTNVPKGNYEYKIVLGSNWGEEYPGQNASLNVLSDTNITFFYNHETKAVTTDYIPEGSDGKVQKDKLYHNTWEKAYRSPYGAIETGTPITLRLESKKDDLTRGTVTVKNHNTGNTKVYSMEKVSWTDSLDYWEATFTPNEKGVYGYKFIAGDGTAVAEYGEDNLEGKTGSAVDSNAGLFQLTVYDPGFETPDWMKEAVVYQIFPDRFFNGNPENDAAKQYARGDEPIEHQDWSELPDNPRLAKGTDYDGDGIWSNDFFGGDIKGIHEKLDYIESLGVNTIYLNPVAKAASNHKYDANDWKAMDPMFGTPEEFQAFTEELEKRGMHLILDGVFNHVGDDSIYFDRYGKYDTVGAYEYWSKIYDLINTEGLNEEEAKTTARAYFEANGQTFNDEYGFHNWFNFENEKVISEEGKEHFKYQAWWGYDSLPEIKSIPGEAVNYDSELNNSKFADYIMYDNDSVAKSWIQNGGSGWRLDVANEVDMEFWREFRKHMKSDEFAGSGATLQAGEKPLILGEIWDDASKYFLGDQYDSVMNYRFEQAIMGLLKNGNAGLAAEQLQAIQEDYPKEAYYALMNLMGSHDTSRAVFLLGNGTDSYERAEFDLNYDHALGVKRLKLASIIQLGFPGAPTIYYGDEAGVTGSKDPDDRRTYPWGEEDTNLIAHYQQVGKVREDHQGLFANGVMKFLYAEDDVFVFARYTDSKFGIVAINRGNAEESINLDVKGILKNEISLTDALDTGYSVTSGGDKVSISIPGMSGRMLVSDAGQDLTLPNPINDLEVGTGEGTATLSWSPSSDAVSYKVYKTNLEGAFYEEVGTTDQTSMTVTNLTNGRSYYFAVATIDKDGNESILVETSSAAVPHYEWGDSYWIGNLTSIEEQTLNLSMQHEVKTEVYIKGATETGHAEGLSGKLKVKGPNDSDWQTINADYVGQAGNNNVFSAKFRPLEVGTYDYKFVFTTDNGATWKEMDHMSATFNQNPDDSQAPAESVILAEPVQESGQVNLNWEVSNPITDDAYLIGIERDGKLLQFITDSSVKTYKDFMVENGTKYVYKVKVYDQSGNVVTSNEVEVTPNIVMVKVTFKVSAPDYTPLTSALTIPNSINGWNTGAWEMSRNGAVSADWEFTTEVQAGTEITYKYVKNGDWDQEGLADHTPFDPTDDDISYYGYGAPGTDLKVVVENQGNNKMVIQDNILRWIDMPVVITSPNKGVSVDKEVIEVKGSAIKGSNLTINGDTVNVNKDMTFAHNVKLNYGENTIIVQVEPTKESKTEIFKNDSGAIGKNTKDYTLVVHSTYGEVFANPEAIHLSKNKGKQGYKANIENELIKAQLKETNLLNAYVFELDINKEEHVTLGIHQQIVQLISKINPNALIQVRTQEELFSFAVKDFKLGSRKDKQSLEVSQGNVTIQLKGNIDK